MIETTHRETAHATNVTDTQARKTAFIVGGVLLLLAAWNLYRGRMTALYVLCGIASALFLSGLLLPPVARQFHILWMRFAVVLGYINSRILLSLMFYGVFTPYGLVMRLFGRDPLHRREARRESYWIPRKVTRQTKEQFERLF
ncbi:MAG TPA: SxtJ family membrane protein [Pyrinomonadaceae bacterium]|nr:SxtJ family membrane protein [Pyrinomonadaceae bacterium]